MTNFTPEQIAKLAATLQISEEQLIKDLKADPALASAVGRLTGWAA